MAKKMFKRSGRTLSYYDDPENPYGHKTFLKLMLHRRQKMTRQGYLEWAKKFRPKVFKEVTTEVIPLYAPLEEINTRKKLIEFIYNNVGVGLFNVFGWGKGKTKTHCKPYHICKIVIKESGKRHTGIIIKDVRLFRYKWFMIDQ